MVSFAVDREELVELVVVRGEIAIPEWPRVSEAVCVWSGKLAVGHSYADSSPRQQPPIHCTCANPVESLVRVGLERMFTVPDEQVGIELPIGRNTGLHGPVSTESVSEA